MRNKKTAHVRVMAQVMQNDYSSNDKYMMAIVKPFNANRGNTVLPIRWHCCWVLRVSRSQPNLKIVGQPLLFQFNGTIHVSPTTITPVNPSSAPSTLTTWHRSSLGQSSWSYLLLLQSHTSAVWKTASCVAKMLSADGLLSLGCPIFFSRQVTGNWSRESTMTWFLRILRELF